MSSETFCTHSEASIRHLDVEGDESLACAVPMVAHPKQVPDSTAQSFSEDCYPHKSSVIFTLQETFSTGEKKSSSFVPHIKLTPE